MKLPVIIIIGLFFVLFFVIRNFMESKREAIYSSLLFSSGLDLIITSFGTLQDKILPAIALITKNMIAEDTGKIISQASETNINQLLIGIILLGLGIALTYYSKKRIYILNINGYGERRIEDYNKDLNLSTFEFKEREIDFIRTYKKGINEISVKDVLEDIEHKVVAFKNESKPFKRGYTGIAPIPFIMYAGTFLFREKIDEYFEFDKKETQTYYKLKTRKEKLFASLKLSLPLSINNSATEAVLAIALTTNIEDGDLKQFNGFDIFKLSIMKPHDNAIKSQSQLNKYVNTVFDVLERQIKPALPNLKRIHLIYSGQSCLALEMGKGLDDTRLCEIINYQYSASSDVRYPWGIILNGDKKGNFIKCMI